MARGLWMEGWSEATPSGGAEAVARDALTAEAAVRLAFGANPRARLLRANFLQQVSSIELAAAPAAPSLAWTRLRPEAGLAKLALALTLPLEDWLAWPARQRQAYWERAAAAQQAAWETLRLEHEVRVAWAQAVGEGERAAQLATAAEAAELAAELGVRYHAAGNLPLHERHALELQSGEALAAAASASVAAAAARATLANLLGLSAADERLQLPTALPPPPSLPAMEADALQAAVLGALQERTDLRAARSLLQARIEEAARRKRWSRLPAIQAGAEREREPDGGRLNGPSVELGWSRARLLEAGLASAAVLQAEAGAAMLAVEVANEVRLRQLAFRRAQEVSALHAERLVPAQAGKLAETQRRQNYMLEGPLVLLEERRHLAELEATATAQRIVAWAAWDQFRQALGDVQ